jgi:hypothetical protein
LEYLKTIFLQEELSALQPKRAQPTAMSMATTSLHRQARENSMTTMSFTKKEAPQWLLAFWREIDDKTFGQGFDCLAEDATCNLGIADWNGRETIRQNLRAFIDTGFTALHDVTEYWDAGPLKVFRGTVTMTPDDRTQAVVKPVMTHFFYMDETDPTKVRHWYGSVGPIAFS